MFITRPRRILTDWMFHMSSNRLDVQHGVFSKLRDGRQLKRERKPRNVMALSRFLQKKNGLYGQQDSITLNDLGMPELSPSHCHRPTSLLTESHLKTYVQCTVEASI